MGKECACTKPPTYRKYRSNGETYDGPAYQPKKQTYDTWTPSWSNICGGKNAKGCANGKCKSVKGMKAAYEAAQAKKAASRCACAVAGSRNTPSSKQQVLSFQGQCIWKKWPKNLAQWNKPTGFGKTASESRKNGNIEKFFDTRHTSKLEKLETPLWYYNPNGCPTKAPNRHEHNAPDWSKNKKTMQTSWKGKDFYSIVCRNCKMAKLHDDDRHQTGWGGKTVDNKDICSGGKCCGKTVHFTAPHDLQHDLEYITLGGPC
jgi:hypothetical protein